MRDDVFSDKFVEHIKPAGISLIEEAGVHRAVAGVASYPSSVRDGLAKASGLADRQAGLRQTLAPPLQVSTWAALADDGASNRQAAGLAMRRIAGAGG